MTTYNTARAPKTPSPDCKCGIRRADCEYHKPDPRAGTTTVAGIDLARRYPGLAAWLPTPQETPAERIESLQRLLDCGAIDAEQFKAWLDSPPDDSGAFLLREPIADARVVAYGDVYCVAPGYSIRITL